MLNASRFLIARRRSGLTKKQLGERVGVDPRSISGFEAGQYQPSDETFRKLIAVLGFPQEFFEADDIEVLEQEGVSFRSMTKMTAKQRDAATAAGSIAYLLSDWVDEKFDLPAPDLPDYQGATPEAAALSLRQYWLLGEKPIKNMVHLLESKGIRVFSLTEDCNEVDAYSVWRGFRPFVFLNTIKSAERRRFDAAHELAHLVLHRHASPSGLEAEKEAHEFAACFLMPTASIRASARANPLLAHVLQMKKMWGVSAAAMTRRLYELKFLTYYHYTRLFVELSEKGYRRSEPFGMKPECSQIWQKVFAELRRDGQGLQFLAQKLLVPTDEIAKLVFGLVTVGLPTNELKISSPTISGHLRLVK